VVGYSGHQRHEVGAAFECRGGLVGALVTVLRPRREEANRRTLGLVGALVTASWSRREEAIVGCATGLQIV
jgi:hypothetical protein